MFLSLRNFRQKRTSGKKFVFACRFCSENPTSPIGRNDFECGAKNEKSRGLNALWAQGRDFLKRRFFVLGRVKLPLMIRFKEPVAGSMRGALTPPGSF